MQNLWMIEYSKEEGSNTKRLYVLEPPPEIRSGLVGVSGLGGPDGSQKRVTLSGGDIRRSGEAPQVELSKDLTKILGQLYGGSPPRLRHDRWNETFFALFRHLCGEEATDPVLQIQVLKQTLEAGRKGSYSIEKGFEGCWKLIENSTEANVNWVDPDSQEAPAARLRAAKRLKEFTAGLKEAIETATKDRKSFDQLPGLPQYDWVGFLRGAPQGGWRARLKRGFAAKDAGELFVVVFDSPDTGAAVLHHVGTIREGRAEIDRNAGAGALAEGRPVLLKKAP